VTGFSITVYDNATTNLPARSDVSLTTASDGSFRARLTSFPTSEPDRTPPHQEIVEIDLVGYLSSYRSVYVHPGTAVNLGVINLVPLDPTITMIGPAGGTAIDSQNLVQLIIPAGALTAETPIQITAFKSRNDLAYPLPDSTMAGYAMDIEPDGLQLQAPATVRLANWRSVPTNLTIPVGLLNKTNGTWSNETFASWDGQMFAFAVNHFSERDINTPYLGQEVVVFSKGEDPNLTALGCAKSSFGLGNGTLRQDFTLPGVTHRGAPYSVGINYDSRLTFGSTSSSASAPGTVGAVATTGNVASASGVNIRMTCLSAPAAEQMLSTTPGSCNAGTCTLGASAQIPAGLLLNVNHAGITGATTTVDVSGNSVEFNTDVSIPLPAGFTGNTIADSGYVQSSYQLLQQGSGCTAGGPSFGEATVGYNGAAGELYNPGADPSVLASVSMPTFVYHRHSSPYGIGWDIDGIGHLYKPSDNSEAVLVTGEGDEEVFSPRSRVTSFGVNGGSANIMVHAVDPVTGQLFRATTATNVIEQVDPTSGAGTTLLSGLGLPGAPQMMAIGYVNGVRHFLLALPTELLDIDASGNQRVLWTRQQYNLDSTQASFLTLASGVAVVGNYAFYTTGNQENGGQTPTTTVPTILYSFNLASATPTAVALSSSSITADSSLSPTASLAGYAFGDLHGLAPAPNGGLYVADRRRNAIFEVLADGSGLIAGDSVVTLAVGSGNSLSLPPLGQWEPATSFGIAQPGYLFMGTDGILWIFTNYGAAVFDPAKNEARWIIFDSGIPNQELTFSLYNSTSQTSQLSFVGLNATTVYGSNANSMYRLDIDLFSSQADPTRTLSIVNNAATLTDTTQDIVEAYDADGRLLERLNREGDAIFSVSYLPSSDTIQAITDPAGGSETFAYANGLLQSITDAAGRTTTFQINGDSDLTSYTEPDGETWTFTYQEHRMTSKVSPLGYTTSYQFSPVDGSLIGLTGEAGETMSFSPGYAQTAGHDANGNTTYTTVYTDTHGLQHTLTLDEFGRTTNEQYTANGVSYTIQHDRPATVGTGTVGFTYRNNRFLGRETRTEINGLLQGIDNDYDNLGRWQQQVDPAAASNYNDLGTFEYVQYDSNGRIAQYSPGTGMDYFQVTRDPNGRPLEILEKNGRQVDFTWNTNGTIQTSTVHGVTTTYAYDPATLNVSSTSDTIGRATSFTYDPAGNVITATTGSTAPSAGDGTTTWTFAHDANNRLVSATDALGNVTTLGYVQQNCGCSEADLLTTLQTPDLAPLDESWTFAYGAEGRLSSVTDPDGNAEMYAYELAGELNKLVDRNGHTTNLTHDSLGRVLSITGALSRSHARAYAAPSAGNWSGQDVLSGSASGTAASTSFASALNPGDYQIGTGIYDILVSGQGNHTRGWADMQFYRDATFQLSYGRTTDDWGRTTTAFDRPSTQLTSATLEPTGSASYVNRGFSYSGVGLPLPLVTTDGNQTPASTFTYSTEFDLTAGHGDYSAYSAQSYITLTRDVAGRVTNVLTQNQGAEGGGQLSFNQAYSYYPTGELETSPEGTFTYDGRGLVATRTVPSGTYSYQYDPLGRNTQMTYPDGHTRVQLYDGEGRITSRCYDYGDAGAGSCYTASYDPVGNPTTMTDPDGTDAITYDALDRVTSVVRSVGGSAVDTEAYSYNVLGALNEYAGQAIDDQRPLLTGTGTAAAAVPNSYNGGVPITLNGGGQVTSLSGTALGYSIKGSLTSVAGFGMHRDEFQRIESDDYAAVDYTYDGANRSSRWKWNGTAWVQQDIWIYDGVDHPLEHTDNSGNRQYYELDLAGNVRRLRAPGGADLGGYRYTAFGGSITDATAPTAPTGVNALPVRWKGRWLMYSTGSGASLIELYDMRARWWWPQGGVFVSVDGFGYASLRTTLWGWPGQNPFFYSDPTGHGPIGAFVGGVVGLVGGTVGGVFLGGGAGLAGLAGGPAVLATVPAGAVFGGAALGTAGLAAGALAGDQLGDWLGKIVGIPDAKPPKEGDPGDTVVGSKQSRRYGPDGLPETDVDTGHDHGQGDPHVHDWGRNPDGTCDGQRGPGRAPQPGDPPAPPGYGNPNPYFTPSP
jgi:YD repeat-containing protein